MPKEAADKLSMKPSISLPGLKMTSYGIALFESFSCNWALR